MSRTSKTIILIFVLFTLSVHAQQNKENDADINYDESKVPYYTLPSLLESAEGSIITTPEEWRTVRRPQILAMFANLVYGQIPVPHNPIKTDYEIVDENKSFMNNKATRTRIKLLFSNEKGQAELIILLFIPNKAEKPVPALIKLSFDDTRSRKFSIDEKNPSKLINGWPVGDILDRGYAFIAVDQQDLVRHNEVEFSNGIHPLFYQNGQSFPKAREWGVLTAIGWGAMRALDYLETVDDVDHHKIALMGHSKLGKATLWAAAQDERFALAISAQSGCAGAALWRRQSGETLKKMVTRFPYWLCRNAWKFINVEEDLPVDQHMLLALIAPRPVYVASGEADTWADPRGEYLSAYHASEVYRLYGKKALSDYETPPVDQAIIKSSVGYHIRKGGHSVEMYDWQRFLDFMDYHFKE